MGRPIPIPVLLSGLPEARLPEVRYTLGEVSARLGIHLRPTLDPADGPPALVYGLPVDDSTPVVPYDDRCYSPDELHAAVGTPAVWVPATAPRLPVPDLFGSVFRLLARLDECGVADKARDRRGVFLTDALPAARRNTHATPLVENGVAVLRGLLPAAAVSSATPLWPGGRKWAVLLTHDTDALRLSAASEVVYNAVKAVTRRDGVRARMFFEGLARRRALAEDPLFGFPEWRRALDEVGVRSAFYLFVRRKVRRDLNDCRSMVTDPEMDWGLLREMADDGWEFGLHPSIHAKEDIDEFLLGKRFVEERLGRPIFGLRHHYWALDWTAPYLTYRKHVNAGFRYDLSMAWRDVPGFRTGTSLPHTPWDPGRRRGLGMYAIPTAIMDGHVIREDGLEGSARRGIEVLSRIREVGGVATLDWHTESAVDRLAYTGHRTVAEHLLRWVIEAGDAWITTPWELTTHWHQRSTLLSPPRSVRSR